MWPVRKDNELYIPRWQRRALEMLEKAQAIRLVYAEEVWRGIGLPRSKKCPDMETQEAK